jgi:hypothetical protein
MRRVATVHTTSSGADALALHPNVLPKHKKKALKNYIQKRGFVQPIVVRPDRNGGYETTDGRS